MKNKSFIFKTLFLFVGIFLLVWLFRQENVGLLWQEVSAFGWMFFVGFILISFFNFALYTTRWWLIVRGFASQKELPSWGQVFWDRLGGFSVSYLTPAAQIGGEPAKIALLHSRGLSIRKVTYTVLIDTLFDVLFFAIFIGVGISTAFYTNLFYLSDLTFISVFVLGFLFLFGIVFFVMSRSCTKKILPFFEEERCQARVAFLHFVKSQKYVLGVSLLSFLSLMVRVGEVFYIALGFGVTLNAYQSILIATLPGIALFLPVPGGIGVFEGSFMQVFSVLGIPLSALSFAVIIRARDLLFIGLGAIHIVSRSRKSKGDKV